MRRIILYVVPLGLAAVVVRVSLALLEEMHRSLFSYFIVIPIWVVVLAVLIMVGWAAYGNRTPSINRTPKDKGDTS